VCLYTVKVLVEEFQSVLVFCFPSLYAVWRPKAFLYFFEVERCIIFNIEIKENRNSWFLCSHRETRKQQVHYLRTRVTSATGQKDLFSVELRSLSFCDFICVSLLHSPTFTWCILFTQTMLSRPSHGGHMDVTRHPHYTSILCTVQRMKQGQKI